MSGRLVNWFNVVAEILKEELVSFLKSPCSLTFDFPFFCGLDVESAYVYLCALVYEFYPPITRTKTISTTAAKVCNERTSVAIFAPATFPYLERSVCARQPCPDSTNPLTFVSWLVDAQNDEYSYVNRILKGSVSSHFVFQLDFPAMRLGPVITISIASMQSNVLVPVT